MPQTSRGWTSTCGTPSLRKALRMLRGSGFDKHVADIRKNESFALKQERLAREEDQHLQNLSDKTKNNKNKKNKKGDGKGKDAAGE